MASSDYNAKYFLKEKQTEESDFPRGLKCSLSTEFSSEESSDSSIYEDEESSDERENFRHEDALMAQLYRKVVDDIMAAFKIGDQDVDQAIRNMRSEIKLAHKRSFKTFRGIDFNRGVNSSGYIRRYAICHTGLVKKAMCDFFQKKAWQCVLVKNLLLNSDNLNVISLGGGPGSDLIGFCCALQDNESRTLKMNMTVVDCCLGWRDVFPSIIRKATQTNTQSLSQFCHRVNLTTSFLQANLVAEDIFGDDHLISCIASADVILIVKLASFLSDENARKFLQNLTSILQPSTVLIFIDLPFPTDLFKSVTSLQRVHHTYLKYCVDFDPKRFNCPSISSTQAEVGIFLKCLEDTDDEDPTDSSEIFTL